MLKCSFCQALHVNNTLFCDECGTYLLKKEVRDTFELEEDHDDQEEEHLQATELASVSGSTNGYAPVEEIVPPPVIRLKIANSNRVLEMTLNKILYFGRLDPVANVYPEIDLTSDNGLEFGVSRQHARLIRKEGGIFIEDLGSINGAFINGRQLVPYQPETVSNGDTLRLGRLDIAISFV